jgi:hypothetical protein
MEQGPHPEMEVLPVDLELRHDPLNEHIEYPEQVVNRRKQRRNGR